MNKQKPIFRLYWNKLTQKWEYWRVDPYDGHDMRGRVIIGSDGNYFLGVKAAKIL